MTQKKCTKCGLYQDPTAFPPTYKRYADGTPVPARRAVCAHCERVRLREAYHRRKEATRS